MAIKFPLRTAFFYCGIVRFYLFLFYVSDIAFYFVVITRLTLNILIRVYFKLRTSYECIL